MPGITWSKKAPFGETSFISCGLYRISNAQAPWAGENTMIVNDLFYLRSSGIIAIVAVILTLIADWQYLIVVNNYRKIRNEKQVRRLIISGFYLGIMMAFYCMGYWQIYRGLYSGDVLLARLFFICAILLSMIALLTHGIIGLAILSDFQKKRLGRSTTFDSPYSFFITPLWNIGYGLAGIMSFLFVLLIVNYSTLFPTWLAWCNPAVILIVLMLISKTSPVLRQYFYPSLAHWVHLIFFILPTIVLWNG